MDTNKHKNMEAYCTLRTVVMRYVFNYSTNADCFCIDSDVKDVRDQEMWDFFCDAIEEKAFKTIDDPKVYRQFLSAINNITKELRA